MLKSIIYIWLSMIIVLNSMVFSVIKMDYAMNKQYIIDNFCVNQDKPEMHCDGKCFLMEKLNEAKQQQEDQPGSIDFSRDFGLFILQENTIGFISNHLITYIHQSPYAPSILNKASMDIFHPPRFYS
ncbi:hypothetical protein [Echinicola pacifica]|nr:hypothetical protein [Echinicola pacifica]